jgi:predicted RNase H-like nuclease (RuvC/YqgF family)
LGWVLLYSLILTYFFETLKFYIAVLMVLTLLWIIISVLTAQTDSNYKQTVETLKEQGQSLNYYKQKITLFASRYEKACAEKGLKYQTDSSNRTELDRLVGKVSFLTPNVFRHETAVSQITTLLNKCENLIEATESATTAETAAEAQKKMQRFVDNAIAEVDMLKNLAMG